MKYRLTKEDSTGYEDIGVYNNYEDANCAMQEDLAEVLMSEGYSKEDVLDQVGFGEYWEMSEFTAWYNPNKNNYETTCSWTINIFW